MLDLSSQSWATKATTSLLLALLASESQGAAFPERADVFCEWYKGQPQSTRVDTFCAEQARIPREERNAEIDSILLTWLRVDGDPSRTNSFRAAWDKADTRTRERLRFEAQQATEARRSQFLKKLPTATDAQLCSEVRRKGSGTTEALGELFRRRHWPVKDDNLVFTHTVNIGMSEAAMVCVLGSPESVNRSVGSWGVHKQHVYLRGYIYTENGTVTSFQD